MYLLIIHVIYVIVNVYICVVDIMSLPKEVYTTHRTIVFTDVNYLFSDISCGWAKTRQATFPQQIHNSFYLVQCVHVHGLLGAVYNN